MQDGWEERRATGASHSHALLYYAFLRFFSPLLSSLVVPLRTFRFSSSSSSVFANARPSFPSPFHPPVLLMSLAACAVVNISPRQVDRRSSNLLCDSLHTRAPSAFAASRVSSLESRRERTRKKPAGPERRTLLRTGMLSRENCVYSWTSAGRIAREKGDKQEIVPRLHREQLNNLDFHVFKTKLFVGKVAIKHIFSRYVESNVSRILWIDEMHLRLDGRCKLRYNRDLISDLTIHN